MFLIDVNLPFKFGLWQHIGAVHQRTINPAWSDTQVWEYARQHQLTIITKDTDFSNRILLHTPPPRVIWLRLGNVSVRDLYTVLHQMWPDIASLSATHKLVSVFSDRLEAID